MRVPLLSSREDMVPLIYGIHGIALLVVRRLMILGATLQVYLVVRVRRRGTLYATWWQKSQTLCRKGFTRVGAFTKHTTLRKPRHLQGKYSVGG